MMRVTWRDRETYKAIQAFVSEHGLPPSLRQLGKALELKSVSAIQVRIQHLQQIGLVAFNKGEPRTLRIIAELPECPAEDVA